MPGSTDMHLAAAKAMAAGASSTLGLGTDVELISSVPSDNPTFVERNFTPAEIAYCDKAADRAASFAGRWTAKECVGRELTIETDIAQGRLQGAQRAVQGRRRVAQGH